MYLLTSRIAISSVLVFLLAGYSYNHGGSTFTLQVCVWARCVHSRVKRFLNKQLRTALSEVCVYIYIMVHVLIPYSMCFSCVYILSALTSEGRERSTGNSCKVLLCSSRVWLYKTTSHTYLVQQKKVFSEQNSKTSINGRLCMWA